MKSPSVRVMCRIKVTKFYLPLTSAQKILEEPKKGKKKKGYGNLKVKKNKKRRDRNITVKRLTRERGQAGTEAAEDSVETPWWEMGGTPHK